MDQQTLNIWNEMNERLFNFVNQKVKNSDVSKDIVQDVFIKVFSKIDSLKNKDKLTSWIFQITRNEIIDFFRKQRFHESTENIKEIEFENENQTEEFSHCVLPMIDALPDKYREAVLLSEIKNISQKELAVKLDISYSGAKSRVQRGREMLKGLLEKCCTISTDVYGDVVDYQGKSCKKDCDNTCD